jgi:Cu(I)/Ag(I) efflux system membrane fusion protein/cobalt-zinc-cadmium efflux system membrane fusion protein
MKRLIALGTVMFVLGIGATVLLVRNPFHVGWIEHVGHLVRPGADVTAGQGEAERTILYWQAPMDPTYIRDAPGKSPMGMDLIPVYEDMGPAAPAASTERRILYWQAPMDPTYIRDEPGKSPMGMDLIPVYADEAEAPAPGTVRIDPAFVQNIGVQSEPVERRDIPFTIRTVGTLTYDDQKVALINTKYEGWIERVYVNYVGESVEPGQQLFEVYSPRLVSTQEEYLNALDYADRMAQGKYPAVAERARSLVASSRQRLEYWDISPEQIAELERTRTPTRTLAVVSPVHGVVVEKMDQALEGMFVNAGMNLYKVADLSTIWVEVEVFEHQVAWLRVGQRAVIELPYAPGRDYVGHVRYLFPFFNNQTRTMKATIELANPGLTLRADMYANVTIEVPSARDVVTVPEEAVIQSGRRNVIVLDRGNGSFEVREVTLGVNGSGLWEVIAGVQAGDRVVVSAQFLIDSESSLKEAIRKVVGDSGATAMPEMPERPTPPASQPERD